MCEQQLATTPPVVHVSPDDVSEAPRTRLRIHTSRVWVYVGTHSSKSISMLWAYINEVLAQNARAEQQRATNWSTLFGRPLTQDETRTVHEAASKLSATTSMSYDEATRYILGLMQRMRIVTVDYAATEERVARDFSGIMYASRAGTGPNYDHWWIGLERVERHNARAQAYARMRRPNTRGRYNYGNATKACSFWRHTRAR